MSGMQGCGRDRLSKDLPDRDAQTLAYWLDLFAAALERRGCRVEATLVGAAALSLNSQD